MYKLNFYACVEYNDYLYFSANNQNGLYKMKIDSDEIECVSVFEKELGFSYLHRDAHLFDNKMWLIPERGKNIVCVNLDSLEMKYYDYGGILRDDNEFPIIFIKSVRYNNKLYLIPRDIDRLLIIDMQSGDIDYIDGFINVDTEKTMDSFVDEDYLYVFFLNQKYYRKINCVNHDVTDVQFGMCVTSAITDDKNWYIIDESFRNLIILQKGTYKVLYKCSLGDESKFYGMKKYDNNIVILPFLSDVICIYDISERTLANCLFEGTDIHIRSVFVDSQKYNFMFFINQDSKLNYGNEWHCILKKDITIPIDEYYESTKRFCELQKKENIYRQMFEESCFRNKRLDLYISYICNCGSVSDEGAFLNENM